MEILRQLRDLAEYQQRRAGFYARIVEILDANPRLTALRNRLHKAGLIPIVR